MVEEVLFGILFVIVAIYRFIALWEYELCRVGGKGKEVDRNNT